MRNTRDRVVEVSRVVTDDRTEILLWAKEEATLNNFFRGYIMTWPPYKYKTKLTISGKLDDWFGMIERNNV